MARSRILWGASLITVFLAALWAGKGLLWLVFGLTAAVPLIVVLMTRLASKKVTAELHAEMLGLKHQKVGAGLKVTNRSFLPLDRVICRVRAVNGLTGEVFRPVIRTAVPARGTVDQELTLKSRTSGGLTMEIDELSALDLFGLFRFKVKAVSDVFTFIHPDYYPLEAEIVYGESLSLDSDMYSMARAGFDPSETFAIREYRPGDRIKQIHWKLSEKLGTPVVREYGLPIQNTILLVLESGVAEGGRPDPAAMDVLGEAAFSLSQSLADKGIVHSLAFYDHRTHVLRLIEINDEGDLTANLPAFLSATPGRDSLTVLDHYMEDHEQCEFAHIVVFTPHHRPEMAGFTMTALVTEVVCEEKALGEYEDAGIRVISVSPESAAQDLVYMEI